jgi:hypothetical protein
MAKKAKKTTLPTLSYDPIYERTILVGDATGMDKTMVEEAKDWRIHYMDSHNKSPAKLASSVYPHGIFFEDNKKYDQYRAEIRAKRKKGSTVTNQQETADNDDKTKVEDRVNRALANKFLDDMKLLGLLVGPNKTKRNHWVNDFRMIHEDQTGNMFECKVAEARFKTNTRIQMYCTKCMAAGRYGLVANCRFIKKQKVDEQEETIVEKDDGKTVEATRKSPKPASKPTKSASKRKVANSVLETVGGADGDGDGGGNNSIASVKKEKEDIIPDLHLYTMRVEELYYHSLECSDQRPNSTLDLYHNNSLVVFKIPIDWIFGDTYKALVNRCERAEKITPFFHGDIDKQVKKDLLEDLDNKPSTKKKKFKPFGELINNNDVSYDMDDRQYLLLPSVESEDGGTLDKLKHTSSMARLIYYLVTQLGIEKEFSPFLLDLDEARRRWHAEKRMSAGKSLMNIWKTNPAHVLYLREISLLFGGNEWRICGEQLIHQWLHTDGNFQGRLNSLSPSQFVPGSLVVPLTDKGRTIYQFTPSKTHHVDMWEALLFRGDMLHGGVTRRDELTMDCAIHAHIDRKDVKRDQALLDLQADGNYHYLPNEHLRFYNSPCVFEFFLQEERKFRSLCQYAASSHNRTKQKKYIEDAIKANDTDNVEMATQLETEVVCLLEQLKACSLFGFLNKKQKR